MTSPQPGQQPDPQNPQQVVYVQAPKEPWYKRPGCLIPLVIAVVLLIGMGSCINAVDKALDDEDITTTSTGDSGSADSVDSKEAAADVEEAKAAMKDAIADAKDAVAKDVPGKDAPAAEDTAAIQVTAAEYDAAYKANEIAADSQYKGKKLIVTGTVDRIDETFGTYSVYLTGDEMFSFIECALQKSELEKAATLTPGAEVTLAGVGAGYDFIARIKKCTIQ